MRNVYLLFIVISLTNCSKEEIPPVKKDYLVIDNNDTTSIHNFVPNIEVYSPMAASYYNFDLDINNDNRSDVQFQNCFLFTKTGSEIYNRICCLHDSVSIAISLHLDSIIRYQDFEKDTLVTYYTENYNSSKTYNNILAIWVDSSYCSEILNNGDTINESLDWQSGTFEFNNSINQKCLAGNGGYYCYPQIIKNTDCGLWKNVSNKFIGLRFLQNNEVKYSWIQISSAWHITIYGYKKL